MATVTITTNETTIFKLTREDLCHTGDYTVWIKNTGVTALDSFKMKGRNSSKGLWEDIVTTTAQWTTIPPSVSKMLLMADGNDPTVLGSTSEFNFSFYYSMPLEIMLSATVASGSTTIEYEINQACFPVAS